MKHVLQERQKERPSVSWNQLLLGPGSSYAPAFDTDYSGYCSTSGRLFHVDRLRPVTTRPAVSTTHCVIHIYVVCCRGYISYLYSSNDIVYIT
jgi:hypothetical protein